MLKVVTGYILVNSEEEIEKISTIITEERDSHLATTEEKESDFILVTDLTTEFADKILDEGIISEKEFGEYFEVDAIKFYAI